MSGDNDSLLELKMTNDSWLNQEFAKIEGQQQALQQEIDQGLHEATVKKGMQPIREKMAEDPSFGGLSEVEKNALARCVAERLLVNDIRNAKITDAYINPNDGDAKYWVGKFILINVAPKVAYEKFIFRINDTQV